MKNRVLSLLLLIPLVTISIILASCSGEPLIPGAGTPEGTTEASSPTTPAPTPTPTPAVPSPNRTADEYLKAWAAGDYDKMYDLTTVEFQKDMTRERFVERYKAIRDEATITKVTPKIAPGTPENSPVITYTVDISTTAVGIVHEENTINVLEEENGDWRVQWEPRLIFKNLWGDSLIHLFQSVPERGSIFDRNGQPLATQDQYYQVGVVPGRIEDEEAMLNSLAEALQLDKAKIKERYTTNAQPDWFMPVGDLPLNTPPDIVERLENIAGVMTQRQAIRVYPNGSAAAQVIGYMGQVTADDLEYLGTADYKEADIIGKSGLEAWGEEYLGGKRGAKLAIISPEGTIQSVIAERQGSNPQDIYTTIDLNIQKAAENALGDKRGTVVVMSPKDGSILAIASHPSYDPNDFVKGMPADKWNALMSDPGLPMNNKAFGSAYPPGSIFKPVTMALGIEKGGFNTESTFTCTGSWKGFGGTQVWTCWNKSGHGKISLFQGLVQSCDVVFYEVGKKLDSMDSDLLTGYLKQFGFGKPLGVDGLEEQGGVAPDPAWKEANLDDLWYSGDSVNLSIGQGYLTVTPLQITNMYNYFAAKGTMYKPYVIQRIQPKDGAPTLENKPTEVGKLPMQQTTVDAIRSAIRLVTSGPRGTAVSAFAGYPIAVSGKTGTAETAPGKPTHAWFLSYGPSDDAQITVGVLIEEGGEGSTTAAPIARKVYEQVLK